ncbi:uncharacterized protein STEHIDRAFT_167054 [Stereum hirsutum FP-91666 SS1]|uniref:uncharacterized protein n=1 Tax=Stereum hirsutum (strain FP-91666) TaxID=721885 RepID=UPI000440D736|nr:uncharacterized protein STEHIDRAFT_167054 [Stereum hirsutum FP-91666 SS1]EIM89166.1 hypothetical protein STEHIDRAFT_167054 [Stereum hirsutum FP-91666 SS1]
MAAPLSPDEVKSIFTIDVLANRIFLASAVLYIYDTLLTLPMEIHGVWFKGWNATSILYGANRYIYILAQFSGIIASFGDGSSSIRCTAIGIVSDLGLVLGGVLTSCLFALRMYALYGQNIVVLLGLGMLIIVKLILDILDTFVAQMNKKSSNFLATGLLNTTACVVAYTDKLPGGILFSRRGQLAEVTLALLFDGIVFALTIAKTYRHARTMRKQGQSSITETLLRDGGAYFMAVLTIQALNTVIVLYTYITQAQVQNMASTFFQLLSPFENMIPVLLANRLYLNLKTWDDPDKDVSQRTSELSGIDFAGSAMLGRIGAPIRTMDEDVLYLQTSVTDQDPYEGKANNSVHVEAENRPMSPVIYKVYDGVVENTENIEMVTVPRPSCGAD